MTIKECLKMYYELVNKENKTLLEITKMNNLRYYIFNNYGG